MKDNTSLFLLAGAAAAAYLLTPTVSLTPLNPPLTPIIPIPPYEPLHPEPSRVGATIMSNRIGTQWSGIESKTDSGEYSIDETTNHLRILVRNIIHDMFSGNPPVSVESTISTVSGGIDFKCVFSLIDNTTDPPVYTSEPTSLIINARGYPIPAPYDIRGNGTTGHYGIRLALHNETHNMDESVFKSKYWEWPGQVVYNSKAVIAGGDLRVPMHNIETRLENGMIAFYLALQAVTDAVTSEIMRNEGDPLKYTYRTEVVDAKTTVYTILFNDEGDITLHIERQGYPLENTNPIRIGHIGIRINVTSALYDLNIKIYENEYYNWVQPVGPAHKQFIQLDTYKVATTVDNIAQRSQSSYEDLRTLWINTTENGTTIPAYDIVLENETKIIMRNVFGDDDLSPLASGYIYINKNNGPAKYKVEIVSEGRGYPVSAPWMIDRGYKDDFTIAPTPLISIYNTSAYKSGLAQMKFTYETLRFIVDSKTAIKYLGITAAQGGGTVTKKLELYGQSGEIIYPDQSVLQLWASDNPPGILMKVKYRNILLQDVYRSKYYSETRRPPPDPPVSNIDNIEMYMLNYFNYIDNFGHIMTLDNIEYLFENECKSEGFEIYIPGVEAPNRRNAYESESKTLNPAERNITLRLYYTSGVIDGGGIGFRIVQVTDSSIATIADTKNFVPWA